MQGEEHLLVLLFSLTQHNELNVVVLHDVPNALGNNVKPLVRGKTGNDRKKRYVLAFGQSNLFLHSGLVFGFSRHTGGRKARKKNGVAFGVVIGVVNAIENSAQLMRVVLQAMLKPVCVLGGLDLIRVARADRGNRIGTLDGSFHQIDAAAVFHQGMILFAEREDVTEDEEIILALILDVVDGKNSFDVAVFGQMTVITVEIDHRKSRLPIMRVQNVGIVIEVAHQLGDGFAKVCITLTVIEKSVKRGALEIILVVDKVVFDAVFDKTVNAAILLTPSKRDSKDGFFLHLCAPFILNRCVQRENDRDLALARSRESRRKRAHNVAKSTCCGKGHRLCTNE